MQVIAFTSQAAWYSFLTERRVVSVAARRSTALALTPTLSNQSGLSGAPGLRGRLWPGKAFSLIWSIGRLPSFRQAAKLSRSRGRIQGRLRGGGPAVCGGRIPCVAGKEQGISRFSPFFASKRSMIPKSSRRIPCAQEQGIFSRGAGNEQGIESAREIAGLTASADGF